MFHFFKNRSLQAFFFWLNFISYFFGGGGRGKNTYKKNSFSHLRFLKRKRISFVYFVHFFNLVSFSLYLTRYTDLKEKSITHSDKMFTLIHHLTNPIEFGQYRMHSFFYKSTKNNSYIVRPIELKF